MLLSIVWDFDPVFFSIGGFSVAYYGLMWVLAFACGIYFFGKIVGNEKLKPALTDSAFMYMFIATVVGARLGHCLFYEPGYYFEHPWQILNLRMGGLASHGAAFGMVIGIWLWTRKWKIPMMWMFDRIGIVIAIGGAFIRLGNLFNSEIYGTATEMPWGFVFVRSGETTAMHPTQIYEALCYLVIFFILMHMYYRTKLANQRGVMFGSFLIMLFGVRFLIESIKQVQEAWEASMVLNMGQILSIPFILAGIWVIIWAFRRDPEPYINMPMADKPAKSKKR